jgi:hypothetical protein
MGPAADPFRVGPYLTGLASGTSLARPCCLGEGLPCSPEGPALPPVAAQPPLEPLSDSEIRVLRYLSARLVHSPCNTCQR